MTNRMTNHVGSDQKPPRSLSATSAWGQRNVCSWNPRNQAEGGNIQSHVERTHVTSVRQSEQLTQDTHRWRTCMCVVCVNASERKVNNPCENRKSKQDILSLCQHDYLMVSCLSFHPRPSPLSPLKSSGWREQPEVQ